MEERTGIAVTGPSGPLGEITRIDEAAGEAWMRLPDGREVRVPLSAFRDQTGDSYFLPMSSADFGPADEAADVRRQDVTTAPVIEEELVPAKRKTTTGTVRVRRVVEEHQETVAMPLLRERVEVRRVLIDRDIDAAPPVRREGNTLIIPVVEEVLVVEKRLRLKEEVHLITSSTEERSEQPVTLRREKAIVERVDAEGHVTREEPEMEPVRTVRRNKIIRED